MAEMAPNGSIVWSPEDLVRECALRAATAEGVGDLNERDFFVCCGAAIKEAYINTQEVQDEPR